MGIREDALVIKANASKLSNKPANRPMRENILEAADRILVETEPPPAPTLVSLTIAPKDVTLDIEMPQQFTASAAWSDGTTDLPALTWTAQGGAITSTGFYTASSIPGTYNVAVAGGGKGDSATVTISQPTEPEPPPAGEVLFEDRFVNGVRAPDQNGVGWRGMSAGAADAIVMAPGVMIHRFGGSTTLTDDAWCEANLKLPDLDRVFIGTEWETGPEYFHRNVSPANNKLLRLFGGVDGASRDEAYKYSHVKFGSSALPRTDGTSQIIAEFGNTESGMGNYSTGPWKLVLAPSVVVRLGHYAQVGTKPGTFSPVSGDGIGRIWINGVLVYDRTDLPIFTAGGYNRFQYAYLPGWSNSGFNVDTELRLKYIVIAREPVAGFTTP